MSDHSDHGDYEVTRRLDLRGKVCPYPTLDTTATLRDMASGETLEVITDYYPAKETIPALMKDLGYGYELKDGDQPVSRILIRKS